MSVRKRVWESAGEAKEAWVVDYADQLGKRHLKTFARKKDADAYHATVALDVRHGTHTPDSQSPTVAEAAKLWLATCEANGLEQTTMDYYRSHVNRHLEPLIGKTKLSALSAPLIRHLEDRLRETGRSPVMVRRVITSLGMILADSMERGLVA